MRVIYSIMINQSRDKTGVQIIVASNLIDILIVICNRVSCPVRTFLMDGYDKKRDTPVRTLKIGGGREPRSNSTVIIRPLPQ